MNSTTYFQVNTPDVIHEIIDGEAVLVNLSNGSYFSLDNVGAFVWSLIEQGASTAQIVEAVSDKYEGSATAISAGVAGLLEQLQAEALIVIGERPPANDFNLDPVQNATKQLFETPSLTKYTDMEDLLMLDPIHDVDETGWPHERVLNG